MTNVVLVDEKGKVVGLKEKFSAHKIPVPLHKAISIVILSEDKTKMLVTKRAAAKPTWPSYWSNAVCSHPYPGESYKDAADRRIFEELGFRTTLTKKLGFIYSAEMENGIWGENELDRVFTGVYEGQINLNSEEVAAYKWIGIKELKIDLLKNSKKYTPWFKIIVEKLNL